MARLAWTFAAGLLALAGACDEDTTGTTSNGEPVGTGGAGGQSGASGAGAGDPNCPDAPDDCGSLRDPVDLDGDGCADRCCFVVCETDFVPSDGNGDGCGDSCADKPCASDDDCDLYLCSFFADTCGAPSGVCSDLVCETQAGTCGCNGTIYDNACDAADHGTGTDTTGASCS